MATIEIRDPDHEDAHSARSIVHAAAVPARDALGIAFFLFHLAVCLYIVLGWLIPSTTALVFYLALLPLIAMQWQVNRGSCVIDNLESVVRTGRWRDPGRGAEGKFLSLIVFLVFGLQGRPAHMDLISYGGLLVLWLLAFRHLSVLGEPSLLSLFH